MLLLLIRVVVVLASIVALVVLCAGVFDASNLGIVSQRVLVRVSLTAHNRKVGQGGALVRVNHDSTAS